jgi:hypothetical protein
MKPESARSVDRGRDSDARRTSAGGYGAFSFGLTDRAWTAALWIHNDGRACPVFPVVYDADSPSRGQRFPLVEPGLPPPNARTGRSPVGPPYYVPLTTGTRERFSTSSEASGRTFVSTWTAGRKRVVPERDFVSTRITFLRIDVANGQQYTLRVYSLGLRRQRGSVVPPIFFRKSVAPESLRLERPSATRCASPPCPWPDMPFRPSYAVVLTRRRCRPGPPDHRHGRRKRQLWAVLSETDGSARNPHPHAN